MLRDRATASPEVLIPEPPVVRYRLGLHEGSTGIWVYVADPEPEFISLPPDFYLQEGRDRIGGTADVMAFVSTWGLPLDPWLPPHDRIAERLRQTERDNASLSPEAPSRPDALPEGVHVLEPGIPGLARGEDLHSGRLIAARELGLLARLSDREFSWQLARVIHIFEITTRLSAMQGFCRLAATAELGMLSREDQEDLLADLNDALIAFAPQVTLDGHRTTPTPTVFNVAALQIRNDILEGAEIRTCRNETCGRQFTKQRGRAQYGAHRSKGVMYCSMHCAKAQAARERRRRARREEVRRG